jgi:hypothetical protein
VLLLLFNIVRVGVRILRWVLGEARHGARCEESILQAGMAESAVSLSAFLVGRLGKHPSARLAALSGERQPGGRLRQARGRGKKERQALALALEGCAWLSPGFTMPPRLCLLLAHGSGCSTGHALALGPRRKSVNRRVTGHVVQCIDKPSCMHARRDNGETA